MNKLYFILIFINVSFITSITSFYSTNLYAESKPLDIVKKIYSIAKQQNFKTNIKSQKQVDRYFDYHHMTKLILGNLVKTLSPKEVQWFEQTIHKIISKTVYKEASNFLKQVKINHEIEDQNSIKTTILSVISKRGEDTEVETYFVKQTKNWKIVNLSIDDESWTENISEQVHHTVKKKKWSSLKRLMKKRLKKL